VQQPLRRCLLVLLLLPLALPLVRATPEPTPEPSPAPTAVPTAAPTFAAEGTPLPPHFCPGYCDWGQCTAAAPPGANNTCVCPHPEVFSLDAALQDCTVPQCVNGSHANAAHTACVCNDTALSYDSVTNTCRTCPKNANGAVCGPVHPLDTPLSGERMCINFTCHCSGLYALDTASATCRFAISPNRTSSWNAQTQTATCYPGYAPPSCFNATPAPTEAPTVTTAPTPGPTRVPTSRPTAPPPYTTAPTLAPSAQPTLVPSGSPSAIPTQAPTATAAAASSSTNVDLAATPALLGFVLGGLLLVGVGICCGLWCRRRRMAKAIGGFASSSSRPLPLTSVGDTAPSAPQVEV
jgi:hypothetical protein